MHLKTCLEWSLNMYIYISMASECFQLFPYLPCRRVVLIEPPMQRRSGFVWRRSSVITPTSAGTSSARSHTSPWPITLAKSTTGYRGWWRKTRCVRRAFEWCSWSWPQIHPLICDWLLCYRIRCHRSSAACFRSLTTPCCTRSSLIRKRRTRLPKGSVKSLWSLSSRWEPNEAYIIIWELLKYPMQCITAFKDAANFQDIKHVHTDNKSLSGPDEFLLGALSRGTDDVISDCRTLWRAWWGSSTPQLLTTLAASNRTQTASRWPSKRRR